MLCPRHHTAVHAGIWTIEMINGQPWARPPRWLDPDQRLRRNTYPHHRNQTHQLRNDLDPPPDDEAA